MLGTALLVFREVLEAALIVSVVYAATRGVAGRGRWIGSGTAVGILGAMLVAASAGAIASAVSGIGQEVFNAGVLFAAVLMIGWHVVWMASHGRGLSAQMKAVGSDVRSSRWLYC
jgi:high-affinity iron transporter